MLLAIKPGVHANVPLISDEAPCLRKPLQTSETLLLRRMHQPGVADLELEFQAVLGNTPGWRSHDPGIADENIQRQVLGLKALCKVMYCSRICQIQWQEACFALPVARESLHIFQQLHAEEHHPVSKMWRL